VQPRIQIARFELKVFDKGIELRTIERVPVSIFAGKNHRRPFQERDKRLSTILRPVLPTRHERGAKTSQGTPAEIARFAVAAGIWEKVVQPRLEALTVDV
jgi:hypothetical protein